MASAVAKEPCDTGCFASMSPGNRRPMTEPLQPVALDRLLSRLEDASGLDGLVARLHTLAVMVTRNRRVGGALNGSVVGHPVHPALAQASLGLLVSASALDVFGRREGSGAAARGLTLAGLAAAAPAAATGLADWGHGHEQHKRVGLVHAALNSVSLLAYVVSLGQRRRSGRRLVSLIGLSGLTVSAYLGAHLSFRQALGANHVAHVPHRAPADWSRLCGFAELEEGRPAQRMVGDQPMFVLRDGADVHVLSDVCSHLAAPLHEGTVSGGCVTCPWHGSTFRLVDGAVVQAPATAPVPVLQVRRDGDDVLVRLPGAG